MMGNAELLKLTSPIGQCYAWPAWEGTLKERLRKPTVDIPLEIGSLDAAALITSLVSFRKMDDFLRGKRNHKDDLIGEDFGLACSEILDSEFRIAINKSIAHVTSVPIESHDLLPVYKLAHPIFVAALDSLIECYAGNDPCLEELKLTKEFIKNQYNIMQKIFEN